MASSVSNFLFGSSGGIDRLPTMDQGQLNLLNQLTTLLSGSGAGGQGAQQSLQALMGMLSGQDTSWQDPYRQQFETQTVPMLAERFAGLGGAMGGGALSSSGFGQALGGAGAQFEGQLAQLGEQRKQSAISQLLGFQQQGMSQALGAQPFAYQERPAQTGFLQQALAAGSEGLLGGIGGTILDLISKKFGGR